jgi:hypothetical protein
MTNKKTEGGNGLRLRECEPYNSTNRTVVGVEDYDKYLAAEKARVIPLKGPWRAPGLGYEDFPPDTWRDELKKSVDKNTSASLI